MKLVQIRKICGQGRRDGVKGWKRWGLGEASDTRKVKDGEKKNEQHKKVTWIRNKNKEAESVATEYRGAIIMGKSIRARIGNLKKKARKNEQTKKRGVFQKK